MNLKRMNANEQRIYRRILFAEALNKSERKIIWNRCSFISDNAFKGATIHISELKVANATYSMN